MAVLKGSVRHDQISDRRKTAIPLTGIAPRKANVWLNAIAPAEESFPCAGKARWIGFGPVSQYPFERFPENEQSLPLADIAGDRPLYVAGHHRRRAFLAGVVQRRQHVEPVRLHGRRIHRPPHRTGAPAHPPGAAEFGQHRHLAGGPDPAVDIRATVHRLDLPGFWLTTTLLPRPPAGSSRACA